MNCQIDLPPGELCGFSPNIGFLKALLEVTMPDQIDGTLTVLTSSSGALLTFAGAEGWTGIRVDSEMIPRWMFAEIAFRELIGLRVAAFVRLPEQMQPSPVIEAEPVRWSEAWTAG